MAHTHCSRVNHRGGGLCIAFLSSVAVVGLRTVPTPPTHPLPSVLNSAVRTPVWIWLYAANGFVCCTYIDRYLGNYSACALWFMFSSNTCCSRGAKNHTNYLCLNAVGTASALYSRNHYYTCCVINEKMRPVFTCFPTWV